MHIKNTKAQVSNYRAQAGLKECKEGKLKGKRDVWEM